MADISELVIVVQNSGNAVKQINNVNVSLQQTAKSAKELNTLGKTLFAGWSFTKIISMTKAMGDAFKNTLVTARKFNVVFGSWNREANIGVKNLVNNFHNTERAAKDLMATIGARLDFGFDEKTLGKVSTDLAKISHELGAFYGKNVNDVSLKLTQALAGQTKGLKEYGINIDINSQKFKELAESIKNSTGETEKGSRALAVYSNILEKTRYIQGTFETQAKTIAQMLEDIKNSFVDGPLANAGQILSKLLGPLLQGINDLLNVKLFQNIGGMLLTITTLTASLKTITFLGTRFLGLFIGPEKIRIIKNFFHRLINLVTLGNFKLLKHSITTRILLQRIATLFIQGMLEPFTKGFLWLSFQILRPIKAFFGLFSKTLQSAIRKIMASIAAKITSWSSILAGPAVAGVGSSLAALGGVLALTIATVADMGLRALSDGYRKWSNKVHRWFSDFWDGLGNWFLGKGWNTSSEITKKLREEWLSPMQDRIKNITDLDQATQSLVEQVKNIKDDILFPQEPLKVINENFKAFEDNLSITTAYSKDIDEVGKKFYSVSKRLQDNSHEFSQAKGFIQRLKNEGKFKDFIKQNPQHEMIRRYNQATKVEEEFKQVSEKYYDLLDLQKDSANKTLKHYEVMQKLQSKVFNLMTNKFTDFTWYQDALEKIQNSVKPLSTKEQIDKINERIQKLKEIFDNSILKPEEARAKYKEIGNLQMQKFDKQIQGLQKEKEIIASTNKMIKQFIDRAMEWKAQGIEAIETTSAEGYKFMTSGFGSLAELGPILKENEKDNKDLQVKANIIAEKSKKVLQGIKNKIDTIDPNAVFVQLKIVN